MIKSTDRIFAAVFGLVAAAAMIYLAVPRGVSALSVLPMTHSAKSLSKGIGLGADDLRDLAAGRATALEWTRDAKLARELARSYQAMMRWVSPTNLTSLIAAAREATIAELSMRPLNGPAWWRLSVMEMARAGAPSPTSAKYLSRSVELQPNALVLMPSRLDTIILHWALFSPAMRPQIRDQFAATWRSHPDKVVRLAQKTGYVSIIRGVLAQDPFAAGTFEQALIKSKPKR